MLSPPPVPAPTGTRPPVTALRPSLRLGRLVTCGETVPEGGLAVSTGPVRRVSPWPVHRSRPGRPLHRDHRSGSEPGPVPQGGEHRRHVLVSGRVRGIGHDQVVYGLTRSLTPRP